MVRRFIYRFPIPPRNVFEKRRDAFRFRREFDPFIIGASGSSTAVGRLHAFVKLADDSWQFVSSRSINLSRAVAIHV